LVRVNGRSLYVNLDQVGGLPIYALTLEDSEYLVFVEEGQEEYQVEIKGRVYPVCVERQRPQLARRQSGCLNGSQECLVISAPLAGCLISLPVTPGQHVETGQAVAVVESMKMKMNLTSPQPGQVMAVHALPGQDVGQGDKLVTLSCG
jgi:biotin carboxyl carrier protein